MIGFLKTRLFTQYPVGTSGEAGISGEMSVVMFAEYTYLFK